MWLLLIPLLAIVWKPVKYLSYDYFYKKDPTAPGRAYSWGKSLLELVSPWSQI